LQTTPVIAIFDIGKTNKKMFLFDEEYNVLLEKNVQLPETTDEDGFACEDVHALTDWVRTSLREVVLQPGISLKALNFSTYGASFVHIDAEGKPVAPLYNYLKPYPQELQDEFYKRYGGELTFSMHTASPVLGSLNSGLQLYRIKVEQPELFRKIHYSLHLPQYMSFCITGRACSDITSIGCHTALWNFPQNHYHEWLYREGISEKLAPLYPSDQLMNAQWEGEAVRTGVGLHDSSAALIPYLVQFNEPFLLISTGTWCISLNPFNQSRLTVEELQQDCLCYMEYRGKPVKASRLFAGYEHEQQVKRLAAHFNVSPDFYKTIQFNPELVHSLAADQWQYEQQAGKTAMVQGSRFGTRDLSTFKDYATAYHQLMLDIMAQQAASARLVLRNCPVKRIFVDGGFGRNPLYMHLLACAFPEHEVYAATVAQASALGAALAVHTSWNSKKLSSELVELKGYTASLPITI
jgi:L-fuculokinase